MGKRMGFVISSAIMLAGLITAVTAYPAVGSAAEMAAGSAKMTLSLTKDYTASPWTAETGWGARAGGKLAFGVKNLLLGWTDLFIEPKEGLDAGENILKGIVVGVKDAVENTVGGAVHIITFPLTELDAPLPEGGTQLLSS